MDNQAVGKRIRSARLSRNMTQEALAEMAGISPTHVSVIERGVKSPQLDTFVAICNSLNVSADEMLQDVVNASDMEAASELAELLLEQSPDIRQRIMRAVRAAITNE